MPSTPLTPIIKRSIGPQLRRRSVAGVDEERQGAGVAGGSAEGLERQLLPATVLGPRVT